MPEAHPNRPASLSPRLSDDQLETFARDGFIKVHGAVATAWVDPLLELAQRQLRAPSRWATDSNPGGRSDRLFTDRYLWRQDPLVQSFIYESGVAGLAGRLMGSAEARIYFDHLLIKQPQTRAATPWHQDIPYWPFLGKQLCSVWVALTPATAAESSLEFVRGSQLWNRYFAPVPFGVPAAWTANFQGEACPDIEAERSSHDIISFDVEPGDALIFSAWTLHGARGNASPRARVAFSTRWLGDDAIWAPHPASDPTVKQADVRVQPGDRAADDNRFPAIWQAARSLPLCEAHT